MRQFQNYDLFHLNSFAIHSIADRYVEIESPEELVGFIAEHKASQEQIVMLGGGSNILFNNVVHGIVLRLNIGGRQIISESPDEVVVRFGAGEHWHDCVAWSVAQGFGGMENMALIPGTIGASPIQNIGAYGREFKDVAHTIEYLNTELMVYERRSAEECAFGYRDSIFKNELKGKAIIVGVELRLSKKPVIHCSYKDVQEDLEHQGIAQPSVSEVFESIVRIRTRKLPSPAQLPNAGSFFKNPVVSAEQAQSLQQLYPEIPLHNAHAGDGAAGAKKIPAAWLIEQCGMKGVRRGDAGVYEKHALVLVNHGSATGAQLIALANEIQSAVKLRFDISLDIEVNIIGDQH